MDIGADQITDTGDYNGTDWHIVFTIVSWDNDTDQSLIEVASTEGFSHYPVGQTLYMSWRLEADTLSLYLDKDDYQDPVGGTEGNEVVTYTRL